MVFTINPLDGRIPTSAPLAQSDCLRGHPTFAVDSDLALFLTEIAGELLGEFVVEF